MLPIKGLTLTAEEECELTRIVHQCEATARKEISWIPECRRVLERRGPREEKTRAASVDRLIEAVAVASTVAPEDPEIAASARKAREMMAKAEDHRWQLAMSGVRIARAEARKMPKLQMDPEDLLQEGYIGLMRAAKRFDPERGIRFSTYARWWVRAQMTRALEHAGRTVRLPGGAVEEIRKLKRVARRYEKLGHEVGIEELADEVGLSRRRAELLLSQHGSVSVDQEDDEGLTILDRLSDDRREGHPEEAATTREGLACVAEHFDHLLDDREKYVLVQHYGLQSEEPQSMVRIGKDLGISRERVRQIKVEAVRRLRSELL